MASARPRTWSALSLGRRRAYASLRSARTRCPLVTAARLCVAACTSSGRARGVPATPAPAHIPQDPRFTAGACSCRAPPPPGRGGGRHGATEAPPGAGGGLVRNRHPRPAPGPEPGCRQCGAVGPLGAAQASGEPHLPRLRTAGKREPLGSVELSGVGVPRSLAWTELKATRRSASNRIRWNHQQAPPAWLGRREKSTRRPAPALGGCAMCRSADHRQTAPGKPARAVWRGLPIFCHRRQATKA
jgi:hypothetical protein